MKKHLIFSVFLLLTLPCMAQLRSHHNEYQSQVSSLTIVSSHPQGFWLFVDDVLQNENPVRSICVKNLWADNFHIRVELNNRLHNCVGQYVDMSRSQTLGITQHEGMFRFEETHMNTRPEMTMNLQLAQPFLPSQAHQPCIDEHEYKEVCTVIKKESFDSSKLAVAKQVVASNPMCAQQIANICNLFSFENNKLEFAKYAYRYCTEKNKYYLLNSAFSYEASKRELNDYIKGF